MSQSRFIDHGLEALLSMNGEIFILEGGYWVRMAIAG
jgi:hypothetical protein